MSVDQTTLDNMRALRALVREHNIPDQEALGYYIERAAIREFDGGMSRADAERAALGDVKARWS